MTLCSVLLFFAACTEPVAPIDPGPNSNLTDTSMLDVSYGTHARHRYDIYLPAGRDTSTPIVLMIHGGAWKAGQKEDFNQYVQLIQSKWPTAAIVNMNYRLASNADGIHHEEMMEDISAVIGDVLAKRQAYQVSENMAIMGASAGGQLAMIYAYAYNDYNNINCVGNIFGPSLIRDWQWYNTNNIWLGANVGDILTEYVGQSWDSTAYSNVSPYWQVNASSQPTIAFHGNLDPIVPVYQSQWMRAKLNSLAVPNEYHEYIAFHGFDTNQSNDVVTKLVAFFRAHVD